MHTEEFDSEKLSAISVKEMPPDEQPREKLIKYGPDSLSNAELLAILLRTGSKKLNVIETSRALVRHFKGLRMLSRQDWRSLQTIPGVAKVKAITLAAAFELTRRIQLSELGDKIIVTSPADAAAYFIPLLRDQRQEIFMVGFLNHAKVLLGHKVISTGSSNSTVVEPAEVMRSAILNNANSIILAHNHPSGRAMESRADINLTRRISEIGKLMGVPVDDHIIVADDDYVSMRNKGLMRNEISGSF